MSRRVLCKFFAHGACLKGEHCRFSHDWKDPKNHVCTYYQRGACSYGSRCRYEHVKVSQPQSSAPSSSTVSANLAISVNGAHGEISDTSENHELSDDGSSGKPRAANLADHPLCSVAAAGNCPRGEKCPYVHGDLCASCAKHCLHPFRPKEREEHIRACQKQKNHLDALKRGQEIECSVCLDRVFSKPTAAERKFGLLSECDHPFCISCIRNWRSSSPTLGMDVNSSLRACPICRKLSYFVIPSVTWYSSKEEKQEIIDSYKAKLRSIDCKHFEFGNGTCPFGSSCFYKHTVKPGSYLWNSAHGLDTGGPSFVDPEGIEILYDSDVVDLEDVDDLSVLLGHLHSPRGVEEFGNYIAEEDLEDRLIVDEEMALILMQTGFIMIDSSSDEDNYFP